MILNDNLANNYISDIENIISNINNNCFINTDFTDIDNAINYCIFIISIEGLHKKSLRNIKDNFIFDYNVTNSLNSIIYLFQNYKSLKPKKIIERFDHEMENYLNFSNKLIDSYNNLLNTLNILINVLPKVIKNIKIYQNIIKVIKFNKFNKRILFYIRYHLVKLDKTFNNLNVYRSVVYDILDIFDNSYQILSNIYIKEDYDFDDKI